MAANDSKKATEEDAMFTRKPLGPVQCASCEKGIVNLLGMKADYLAWNKLPFREPNERIAKYGQGFSKILGMMKVHDSNVGVSQSAEPGKFSQTYAEPFNRDPHM